MVAVFENEKYIPDLNMDLGLNLIDAVLKVNPYDSVKVMELKGLVAEIDRVLRMGDDDELVVCNKDMMRKYSHLILHSGAHLIPVNEHTLRQRSFEAKYAALHAIGLSLVSEIAKEKTERVTGEWVNSGIEYDL